ncbi:MAG: peptide chain release factor 2 [Bacilli bacterium]|nr:peptide chain release factor 2 [Bacilli bacterium]
MEKFEILKHHEDFKRRINELKQVLNIEKLIQEIQEFDSVMQQDGFWNDTRHAKSLINKLNTLKNKYNLYVELEKYQEELTTIIEFNDDELFVEATSLIDTIIKKLDNFEELLLLNEEYDSNNCILEIHPGAGGTESQDWALMLFRMYKRFAEIKGFKFSVLDYLEAIDAGIKSVTCLVEGVNAYGLLKSEKGVHRLVRISPFDSNARRHTSFAGVNITPEVSDDIDIEINVDDLRVDTYRSSGAGGQYVNTTDSAVRITHIPTGIVVSCQNERSQIQNRERAMQVLKAKLYEHEKEIEKAKLSKIEGDITDNAFGSQIRSYVLHPYSLVKDHRTNYESMNPQKVLDGDLMGFINAYLKNKKTVI